MTGRDITTNPASPLYDQIRQVLLEAQSSVFRAVNTAMVHAYFEIGRLIVEDEQHGEARAEYGEETLKALSKNLKADFGKGFSVRNLRNMRSFYLAFEKRQTLSAKLSWSHYILLMRIDNKHARDFYVKEAESENWSVGELVRQYPTITFNTGDPA